MIGEDPTREEYDAFKQFLESACGILLGDNKRYLVKKSRLRKIMEEEKIDTLGHLIDKLQASFRGNLREL